MNRIFKRLAKAHCLEGTGGIGAGGTGNFGGSSNVGSGGYGSGFNSDDAGWGYGPTRADMGGALSSGNSFSRAVDSVGLRGALTGGWASGRFDTPGAVAERADPRAAMNDALGMLDAQRQAGLLDGASWKDAVERVYSGNVGDLAKYGQGALAEKLSTAYSPRTTGLMSMVKGMFSAPEKVDTPYSAMNSLITSGYAAPGEDGLGFKATPKAAWDAVKSFLDPFAKVAGAAIAGPFGGLLGNVAMKGIDSAVGSGQTGMSANPVGIASGALGMAGLGNVGGALGMADSVAKTSGIGASMDVAGVNRARGAQSSDAAAREGSGGLLFDPVSGFVQSPAIANNAPQQIDPMAWFAGHRNALG